MQYFFSEIRICFFLVALFVCSCQVKNNTLFTQLSPDHSRILFENVIKEDSLINIMSYEYTYNGGGVAAGDFNNDGLCDLYFTGNTVSNRLYLNQGNLKFKDISEKAGVLGRKLWKTGVTVVDINADGWLDLYVCYSGPEVNQLLSNQLFVNNGIDKNGDLTFTERALEFGLDATGTYSTQAAFFDYDLDGDLDMFLINHGNHFYSPFINTNQLRNIRHPQFGNRLYRNDAIVANDSKVIKRPFFTEVSTEAGIHGGGINFGLGVSVSDVNNDGWPDVYVTNDYEEQDFLYLNNTDGTFKECLKKSFGHLSRNGMGTDLADFNNDGRTDLIEVDMWPEDNFRQKLLKGPDDFYRYNLMVDSGFHYQQMRNTLQLNTGVEADGLPLFCEMGQLAGVSATDWSWAPLFIDVDNDGFKDIFITNGYLRDFTSMDFLKYTVEEAKKRSKEQGKELELYDLVSKMPSTKTNNYLFRNNGDLSFSNNSKTWGVNLPNLSFGATYADLDNDGDLELITNNTNEQATIWLNNSESKSTNAFLRIQLIGSQSNPLGIGAKVFVETENSKQLLEQFLTRGFQSSVEPILHFGLGDKAAVNRIEVIWPDLKKSVLTNVKANQMIIIDYASANNSQSTPELNSPIFVDVTKESEILFEHRENNFNDFDREPLLPYQLSKLGPALAKGDVNGDGLEDFFIGGASGQSGQLLLGDGAGHFKIASSQSWSVDAAMEDIGSVFFDVEGDGDLDLFVVSGGNEFPTGSPLLDDRLYINTGKGDFIKAEADAVIADHASGSCVAAGDYDQDGDLDLYVGGRLLPGNFPMTTPGAILRNETDRTSKKIKFVVATNDVNADLREPGMVKDALWTDYNNDGWLDLLIVGDWMPVRLFENRKGKLVEIKNQVLENSWGLWNKISQVDFDADGDMDYILGNAGINLPWNISEARPLKLYYSDFNLDGQIDPIICYSKDEKEYPVASRDELLQQLPELRKKFVTYSSYANATIEDILEDGVLNKSGKLKVQTTQSSILENLGNNSFKLAPMPILAQVSAINGILTDDFNSDGNIDILLAGNFYPYRTQYGRSDASIGLLLLGDGNGEFKPMANSQSGLLASGDIRGMVLLTGKSNSKFILVSRNNDKVSLFGFNKH